MSEKTSYTKSIVKNSIKNARENAGLSQGELAEKVGLSKSYISRLEGSKRRTSLNIVDLIARELGVSRSSIVADAPQDHSTLTVTVCGDVQSESWTERTEWPQEESYDITVRSNDLYPGVMRVAYEVVGPGHNKVYPEGTILICVRMDDIKEPMLPGRRYIICRFNKDNAVEQTVKTYLRDPQGGEWLYPESTDPKMQAPISMTSDEYRMIIAGRVIGSYRDE